MSTRETSSSTTRAHRARRVLDGEPRARLERPLAHPADARLELARDDRRLRPGRRACRRARRRRRPRAGSSPTAAGPPPRAARRRLDRRDARAQPGRQHDDLVAGAPDAAGDLAGVAAVVVVLVRHRPDHPLHREAPARRGCGRRRSRSSRDARAASARRTTASCSERSTTLSPLQRRHRDRAQVGQPERRRGRRAISSKRSCEQSTRSILLTATTTCGTRRIEAMYAWRRVCSTTPLRASTRMTATSAVEAPVTMLRVYWTWPGRVGELEAAPRRDERAVGDVDRDPLLALGAQAVGEQREVDVAVAAPRARSPRCARAGRRRSASCRRAAGRSASTCRRRPSRT